MCIVIGSSSGLVDIRLCPCIGAIRDQTVFVDDSSPCIITGMSKIAADSRGLTRAFQQRQRCLLWSRPSVAMGLSDRRPAPTKATLPSLVSTVFGHCETALWKNCRDHGVTLLKRNHRVLAETPAWLLVSNCSKKESCETIFRSGANRNGGRTFSGAARYAY
jgi:hypothetical protein